MKQTILLTYLFCCIALQGLSQAPEGKIQGRVISNGAPVSFANIALANTSLGASADENGYFEIKNIPAGKYTLIISAIGFTTYQEQINIPSEIIVLKDIQLKSDTKQLEEVVVTGTMKETFISESPVKVEVISSQFLQKTPTSNMIEAMDIVNGIQPQVTCGICGTNELRINGMEGPYSLLLIDGMPIVSALSTVYGLNGIPTSLIDRIEIIKGPASTLYGTEAVAGVINVITKKPEKMPSFSVNSFVTSHLEKNIDATYVPLVGKHRTFFSSNYFGMNNFLDFNSDGFNDVPLVQRISLANKWSFHRRNNRLFNIFGRYYYEDRFGGQRQWSRELRGSNQIYGESIFTSRLELIGTYQLPIARENARLDFSFNSHHQNSFYGNTPYHADQSIFFANLLWDKKLGKNDLLFGSTFRYQIYDDNTPATATKDKRFIPGLFVQDEVSFAQNLKVLGGLRWDYHQNHGHIFSPRLNIKYNLSPTTTARLNAGTGFRIVNLFTEDHAALTGSRQVVLQNNLQPERSYTTSLNINHETTVGESTLTLDVDGFYTYFTNKIIPDYNTDPNLIIYDNLAGNAITRGVSVTASQTFLFPLTWSAGITYQNVFQREIQADGTKIKQPVLYSPDISGVFAVSYTIKKLRTSVDYTGRVVGKMALPTYDFPLSRPSTSPWYSLQNIQVTHQLKHNLDLYMGVKNIFSYTQDSPLINPQHPFSDSFDTAYVYGPLQPRRFLLGIRWHLD